MSGCSGDVIAVFIRSCFSECFILTDLFAVLLMVHSQSNEQPPNDTSGCHNGRTEYLF